MELSLNVTMFLIFHLAWKTNQILQCGSLFFIMQLIFVWIWRANLPEYGRAITSFFYRHCPYIVFGASILSKNSLMHLLTRSRGKLFLYKILFNLSISCWSLIKSEHKLKHRNRNDLIKLILYASGMKLLNLV